MDKLSTSIQKAFLKQDNSLKEYYSELLKNLYETEKSTKRSIHYLTVLIVVYFIIIQSSVQSIDIGPFKINNLNIIINIFPLIISYKYHEFISLLCFLASIHKVFNDVYKKLYPDISQNNLDILIKPESSENTADFYTLRSSKKTAKILSFLDRAINSIILGSLPILVIIYSIYYSFHKFGFNSVINWIIMICCSIYIIQSILILVEYNRQVDK
jgi:hypothetical protein